jgi:hypothetical protein
VLEDQPGPQRPAGKLFVADDEREHRVEKLN